MAGFGESSVDFVVEYWVNGIDDGKNKYKSHVLFAIWNALKAEGIEMPYPQRVVHHRGLPVGPRMRPVRCVIVPTAGVIVS